MKNSPNGWMAYVAAYRIAHPEEVIDYKALLQQYIKGVKIDEI